MNHIRNLDEFGGSQVMSPTQLERINSSYIKDDEDDPKVRFLPHKIDPNIHSSVGVRDESSNHVHEMDDLKNEANDADNDTLSEDNPQLFDPLGDKDVLEFKKSVLSFQDINYLVKGKRKWPWTKRKSPIHVLDHVSGIFPPGVNAIMGPSGGGKTSLLTVLASRKIMTGAEGIILMNDRPLSKNFKTYSGFVTQEDVLMATLTVRENIAFSASVRLSAKIPAHKKKKMVQIIIDELNLGKCADSLVGGEHIRGVSGGEKKRCNIGVELVTVPSILFLDEPTTGLDASTAHTVIQLLKKLASKGCNIIMSIHQPRYDIFKMFDTLILLSTGQVVYHGPSYQTLDYFTSLGLGVKEHNNPADFFLDIIERNSLRFINGQSDEYSSEKMNLPKMYKESGMYHKAIADLDEINASYVKFHKGHKLSMKLGGSDRTTFPTSFCHQLLALSKRTFINLYRDPQSLYVQLLSILIYSLIVGSIYFNVDNSALYGIQNRSGALYFIIMDQIMSNLSAIDLFIGERALYIHEATNGFYRVSVYFFSKLFGDLIPMRYLPITIVAVIAYWMIGLQASIGNYLIFIISLLFLTTASSSIVLLSSVTFNTVDIAGNYCALYLILLMVLGGFFVNLNSIPRALRWLKYLSIFRYGNNVLLINEIKDQKYCDHVKTNESLSLNQTCALGNDYLEEQGIAHKTLWDMWSNNVALILMSLIFWLIAYIQLLRLKKNAKG